MTNYDHVPDVPGTTNKYNKNKINTKFLIL